MLTFHLAIPGAAKSCTKLSQTQSVAQERSGTRLCGLRASRAPARPLALEVRPVVPAQHIHSQSASTLLKPPTTKHNQRESSLYVQTASCLCGVFKLICTDSGDSVVIQRVGAEGGGWTIVEAWLTASPSRGFREQVEYTSLPPVQPCHGDWILAESCTAGQHLYGPLQYGQLEEVK